MADMPDAVFRATLRRAQLVRSFGITEHELRGPLWRNPMHGRYSFIGTDPEDPMQRIFDALSVMPDDGALTGWAAAYLAGVKDLDGRSWTGELEPVTVAVPYQRRIRRDGIRTIRTAIEAHDVTRWGRVSVTAPARTCFELMRQSCLEDAVVVADAMLRAQAVTLDGLRQYVATKEGWRGVPVMRAALELADERTASCPESRLRMVWVMEAGLPRPEVNVSVFSASGAWLGIPDLLDIETGLVGEYDGAQHRELAQHTADNVREERLEAYGLRVVRATSVDLKSGRRRLVARLRGGYEQGSRGTSGRRWML